MDGTAEKYYQYHRIDSYKNFLPCKCRSALFLEAQATLVSVAQTKLLVLFFLLGMECSIYIAIEPVKGAVCTISSPTPAFFLPSRDRASSFQRAEDLE